MTDIELGQCECCYKEPAVGVASVPFIAMSIAWCRKCLDAGIIPYWAAVANTACCGGFEHTNTEWRELVTDTLAYFGRPMDTFLGEVAEEIETLDREAREMSGE